MTADEVQQEIADDFRAGYIDPYISDAEAKELLREVYMAAMMPKHMVMPPRESNALRHCQALAVLDAVVLKKIQEYGEVLSHLSREAVKVERTFYTQGRA